MEINYRIIEGIKKVLNLNENKDIVINDDVYELATPAQLETALDLSVAVKGAKQIWLRRGGMGFLYYRVEEDTGDFRQYDINEVGEIIKITPPQPPHRRYTSMWFFLLTKN